MTAFMPFAGDGKRQTNNSLNVTLEIVLFDMPSGVEGMLSNSGPPKEGQV